MIDGATDTDESRLFALIALITDAQLCAQRAKELQDERAKVSKLIAQNEDLVKQANEALDSAKSKVNEATNTLSDAKRWSGQLEAQEKALKARLGQAADRERDAVLAISNVKYREDKIGERENTMNHREAALAEREKAVAKSTADAEALLKSYDEAKHKAALKLAS